MESFDELTGLSGLGCVIEKDGTFRPATKEEYVTEPEQGSYGLDPDEFIEELKKGIRGWVAVSGISSIGSDILMHPSEVLHDEMVPYLLEEWGPGLYTSVPVCEEDEDDENDIFDVGWVLVKRDL